MMNNFAAVYPQASHLWAIGEKSLAINQDMHNGRKKVEPIDRIPVACSGIPCLTRLS
jgi:hypothetical protein